MAGHSWSSRGIMATAKPQPLPPRPKALRRLRWRTPLAFALLAGPRARSPPRQARYGRMMTGFLAYVMGMNLMMLGKDWVAEGRIPVLLGLWWLVLPLLGFAAWMYFKDGRVTAPKWKRAK